VLIDITSDCTKYINVVAGDFGGLYVGKGAVTIPDFAKVSQRITLELANTLDIAQGSHSHAVTPSVTNFSFDQLTVYSASVKYGRAAAVTGAGTPISCRIKFDVSFSSSTDSAAYTVYLGSVLVAQGTLRRSSEPTAYSASFTCTSWAALYSSGFYVNINHAGPTYVVNAAFEVTHGTPATASAATGVALLGDLGLTGNSVADIMIGDAVLVSMTRTMATCAAVFNDLLTTYCGDSTAITQVGTFPASFAFNGVINEYRPALEWFDLLAFQCASYFRKSGGVVRLIYRDPTTAAAGTISACKLSEEGMKILSHRKAPVSDVINTIKVLYKRQWDSTAKQADAYSAVSSATSSTSIAIHGVREEPNLFMFDFVTSATMADALRDLYLVEYGTRKWQITFAAFLDSLKYEFADFVTLNIESGQKARVIESGLMPGDTTRIDTIEFTVIA
jgi:hypothetical protein